MKPTKQQLIDSASALYEADEMIGLCHACGEEKDGCEPDARHYNCEHCDKNEVFGAAETLIILG